MSKLSNKVLIGISVFCIVLSIILAWYSLKQFNSSNRQIKELRIKNNLLKKDISDKEVQIIKLSEKICADNSKISQLDDLEQQVSGSKVNIDISKMIETLQKYQISDIDFNLKDIIPKITSEKEIYYEPLRSLYYNDEKLSAEDQSVNILISSIGFNDSYLSDISNKIDKYNSSLYKDMGILKFYETNNNSYLKYFLNKYINENYSENYLNKEKKGKAQDILNLKSDFINDFLVIGSVSDLSISKLKEEKNIYSVNFSEISDKNSQNMLKDDYIFLLDTLSQNINVLDDFEILEKDYISEYGYYLRFFKNKNRCFIIEKISDDNRELHFYNILGQPVFKVNLSSLNSVSFSPDTIDAQYNKSKELYDML